MPPGRLTQVRPYTLNYGWKFTEPPHIICKAICQMKELLLVSVGSFFGGGLRFAVSKWLATCANINFPLGTFTVNVVGCLIIGLLSGANTPGGWLSPQAKLLLTTGFCGGFTTFSTFMNESGSLVRSGDYLTSLLYVVGSVTVGFAAVAAGHLLSRSW